MRELSLNVLDIVQNSIAANATFIEINIDEELKNETLVIKILDNGNGMEKDQLLNVTDPFYTTRTTRNVGLGIPLFKMAAEITGGSFFIESVKFSGTNIKATFKTSNIDMTPLGDINSTINILIRCNPNIDFLYKRSFCGKSFDLDTRNLRLVLEEVPLDSEEVLQFIDNYLEEQTEIIFGGTENEIIRRT